jgi:hypothetical protein
VKTYSSGGAMSMWKFTTTASAGFEPEAMKHFASLQEIDLAQLLENKKLHLKS